MIKEKERNDIFPEPLAREEAAWVFYGSGRHLLMECLTKILTKNSWQALVPIDPPSRTGLVHNSEFVRRVPRLRGLTVRRSGFESCPLILLLSVVLAVARHAFNVHSR